MNHTPKRVACDGLPSKNIPSSTIGDQTGSPNSTSEEEPTMIPIKLTMENANGTAISCGHSAAEGVDAREAKSGAFLGWISVCALQSGKASSRSLRDEGGHVADAGHEAHDHAPG